MNNLCINKVLERLNTLQRMRDKYDDRSYEAYQAGDTERSDRLDQKVDKYDSEIKGITYTLRSLGLGVWQKQDSEWVIPLDDIKRAV